MDVDAFVAAHRRHAAAVFARCRRLVRDVDAARDITQEVFIRCLDHHRRLRDGGELLAWLYRVATNLCLNHLRDQKSRRTHEGHLAPSQPEWQDRPSAREILQLLEGLDARAQEIAIYVHVDGMTHEEAAAVARVSDRTVRNCLARFAAHGRLRAGLPEDGAPRPTATSPDKSPR